MAYLELDDVTKRYDGPEGTITAVDGVSLAVDEEEFLVLVGPSGCGKTTTLRMIAGLERPDEGQVRIQGEDVTDQEPHERNVAMVFQNYALYPHMTVRRNIGYGLEKSTSLGDDEVDEKVREIAELMGIGDLLEKKPGQLSGGQKQRVATGRALVRDPTVFLLDEPLSNLDAKLRLHMRTEIQRIQTDFGTTTVYVTHDQEEAMTMGDRIAVMDQGTIQQIGPPSEIYDAPANQFVAEFVGNPSMNFFDVTLAGARLEGAAVTLDLAAAPDGLDDGPYVMGVRPEAISLGDGTGVESDTGADDGTGGVATRATVSVVEPTGSEAVVYLDAGGAEITAKLPRDRAPEEGREVAVAIPETTIYLFDDETGETVFEGRSRRPATEAP